MFFIRFLKNPQCVSFERNKRVLLPRFERNKQKQIYYIQQACHRDKLTRVHYMRIVLFNETKY